ncbi:amino acid ABC transporter substrate-binding protein [Pokkaliibacter plantistimulans]|uniref:Amino acid ABC transporter substrate-binding protein n=1 Tax=Pokkaliibacter plantistimulans TaxID=1635171 RepID=A0ABX5LUH7_9GAMM|nr:branched-chain amino acid ABC transporter substrate-binding protein [Pokkaliibacter plantistimulans]PXF30341.1 amino acid ABC transporter substrate-binding protein [Pokkaliibacter plantistimulans]
MSKSVLKKTLVSLAVASSFAAFAAHADIKVGIAGPMTGAYAAFGEQLWKGASQAAEDINAAGGINGEKLVLVKADDACEPKQAVSVANRLVDSDQVAGVIGHFCSSSSIPASEIYDEGGISEITPASTNPQYTERGLPGVFRTCGRDDQQGTVAADYIIDKLKATKVAVIHDKDTYGQGLADATKAQLNKRGVTEVMYEGLTRGEKDFNALVTKIRASGAEVVYFGGLHAEAGALVHQLRDQGFTGGFMSGDGITSEEFVTAAGGPKYVDGVYMTFGADPRNNTASADVIAKFRAAGYEPEGYTLYSYAALQVLAAGLKGANGDKTKVAEWIHGNTVPTVMGDKQYDAKGDLTVSDYVMYEWHADGKYTETTN